MLTESSTHGHPQLFSSLLGLHCNTTHCTPSIKLSSEYASMLSLPSKLSSWACGAIAASFNSATHISDNNGALLHGATTCGISILRQAARRQDANDVVQGKGVAWAWVAPGKASCSASGWRERAAVESRLSCSSLFYPFLFMSPLPAASLPSCGLLQLLPLSLPQPCRCCHCL